MKKGSFTFFVLFLIITTSSSSCFAQTKSNSNFFNDLRYNLSYERGLTYYHFIDWDEYFRPPGGSYHTKLIGNRFIGNIGYPLLNKRLEFGVYLAYQHFKGDLDTWYYRWKGIDEEISIGMLEYGTHSFVNIVKNKPVMFSWQFKVGSYYSKDFIGSDFKKAISYETGPELGLKFKKRSIIKFGLSFSVLRHSCITQMDYDRGHYSQSLNKASWYLRFHF